MLYKITKQELFLKCKPKNGTFLKYKPKENLILSVNQYVKIAFYLKKLPEEKTEDKREITLLKIVK